MKRPTERVGTVAQAATVPKQARTGSLSPADADFQPSVDGRARGSSSTPLKAILEKFTEQQRLAAAASGSDDGTHIGFDIPDSVPAGAAAADAVADAAADAAAADLSGGSDEDEPPQRDDEDPPLPLDAVADQLPGTAPKPDQLTVLTAEDIGRLTVPKLKAALTLRGQVITGGKPDLVERLTKHVAANPNFCPETDGLQPFSALTAVEIGSGTGRKHGYAEKFVRPEFTGP